jgi:uncharacterized protein (DUF362 family)
MKRRDFLKQTGKAVALASVATGAGLYFNHRTRPKRSSVTWKTHSFEVPADPRWPAVTLAKDANPAAALSKTLAAIGGIRRFIQPGDRVTIKPNIGWDRTPEQAANTNPDLVAEMVAQCLTAGAAEVIVTDVSCNDPRRCFARSAIGEAATCAGARVILPADDEYMQINLGGELLAVWPVLRHFVQTDRLINMPIVKHHSLSACTIGMKNLYGILGGRRNQLHQDIDRSIVELAAFARPTLTVVDATRVLMRGGPQGGSLADVATHNTVICATDQVAADARAAEFLDLQPDKVGHIVLGDKLGVGSLDYRAAGYKEVA